MQPNWYASPDQVHCAFANDRVVSVIRMVHWRNLLPWYIFFFSLAENYLEPVVSKKSDWQAEGAA